MRLLRILAAVTIAILYLGGCLLMIIGHMHPPGAL